MSQSGGQGPTRFAPARAEAAYVRTEAPAPARRRLQGPLLVALPLCVVTAVLGALLVAVTMSLLEQVFSGVYSAAVDTSAEASRGDSSVGLVAVWARTAGLLVLADAVLVVLALLVLRLSERFARLTGLAQGVLSWVAGTVLGVVLLVLLGLLA